ncbi:MAG: NAD(P)/FAD-dependent oxidoreductase [Rhizorhabdus sp.]|uniref:flavin-containing monooxygenase n=1 Tax=Rhizorhabdus sp. TaxID=1968843 RepID=UPI001B5B908D|nr:NAD(P)/FAD-dependent oxidoreductase [Rhizorhabdus sp.]MBP8232142.1 NAD(P)/FAD-dependent oxidoreductase [Rhizorhabdus sp.]
MNAARPSAVADDIAARPDPDRLRAALALADPNILRLTLYHLSGDPSLAAMTAQETALWAGALFTYTLPESFHQEVRDRAFDWLMAHWGEPVDAGRLDRAHIRETMELFGHGPLSDSDFRFGAEEAAFDPFPRGVHWTTKPSAEILADYPVLVVGAGVSGLCAAIHLEQLDIPYQVIERQDDVGGTWNLNNYPEARVDSTSMIYQYKFEKRYPWSEFFASGPETRAYLNHCADKYGVRDKLLLNTDLVSAQWLEDEAMWSVEIRTRGQEARRIKARFIISASGLFSTPKLPDIPGIEGFEGLMRHTTDWQDVGPLEGRRVAQIGTGASGAQVMPYIARHADHVTVFQRTANYVLPMEGYRDAVPADMQWLFDHVPLYWHWYSYGMHFLNAQLEKLQEFDPEWQAKGGIINQRNDQLRDNAVGFIRERLKERPDLIEKMIPDYPPMARRPTVDNGWYDALLMPNVDLVTDPIDHVRKDAIVTKDGTVYPCDVIVCAAGFATTRYLWPAHYVGRDGTTLDDLWGQDGPRAHLGIDMPGFPNFFMFFGPSAQGRAGSFYSMAEMWTRYALKAIVQVVESGSRSIEVTQDAFRDFNARLDAQNKKLLWESYGKGFYYLTDSGRSVVNSPWPVADIHDMLYEPNPTDYRMS